ncbi:MAG: hypothetical protein QM655_02255 [Nocardioidaceae bacterium]
MFRATSHWGGYVDGKPLVVDAGSDTEPSFDRLPHVGTLTITAEQDKVLVPTDGEGGRHHFDVRSGSFTD